MKRWVVHVGYWHQMTMVAHLIHIWLEGVGAKTTEFKCWIIWKETASHLVAALIHLPSHPWPLRSCSICQVCSGPHLYRKQMTRFAEPPIDRCKFQPQRSTRIRHQRVRQCVDRPNDPVARS